MPSIAIVGQASWPVLPNAAARSSRKKPLRVLFRSVLPSRVSTRSRRLVRTESPTSSAPPNTPAAVATPSSTARFVRQYHVRLRANRVEVRISQFVPQWEPGGQFRAVSHHHEDGLLPLVQFEQERSHHVGGCLVEIAGGLVAQQQQRLVDEGARQRYALLLAAGKLGRAMIEAIAQADLCQQVARTVDVAVAIPRNQRRHQHIFEHGALRQQAVVLKDEADCPIAERRQLFLGERERIASIERDRTGSGLFQPAEDVEERALARAGRAHDGGRVAALKAERNARENGERPAWGRIFLGEVRDFKHARLRPRSIRTLQARARPCARRCNARGRLPRRAFLAALGGPRPSTVRRWLGPGRPRRPVPPEYHRRSSRRFP